LKLIFGFGSVNAGMKEKPPVLSSTLPYWENPKIGIDINKIKYLRIVIIV
jgi:hypothetical protein